MLTDMIDDDLPDEGEGQTGDQPPAFPGRPTPGGKLVGDAALRSFEAAWPEVARIRKDDGYGTPCPMNPRREQRQQQLALDAANRAAGAGSGVSSDFAKNLTARIGHCY